MRTPNASKSIAFHLAALCAALLVATTAGAETIKEEWSARYPLSPGGFFSVENTNGGLEISAWDREEVLVEATKTVKTMGRERAAGALEAVEIEVSESPSRLSIKTVLPRSSSGITSWLFGRGVEARVSYRVRVPSGVDVTARTVNGTVKIEAVEGEIDAKTTNGQIRIHGAQSSTQASSTNGSIRAEFSDADRVDDLNLRTTNGAITVYVPDTLACSVSASTVHGAVSTDFPIEVEGSRSWGRKTLEGVLNGGGGHVSLRTVNGSIQLRKTGPPEA